MRKGKPVSERDEELAAIAERDRICEEIQDKVEQCREEQEMTTIEEYVRGRMQAYGLIALPREECIAIAKQSKGLASIKWDDDVEGYPRPLLIAIWVSVSTITREWLDANIPDFPNRHLF